jgi:predicted DNA-binding transcriptional regulator YafY
MPHAPGNESTSRIHRLLWLIREIRHDPKQDLKSLLSRADISRSQFYKDKNVLATFGFSFEYKTGQGFQILEDRLISSIDLSLSDRILIMFSLRHLYASGEGHLAARALEAGRKLVYGLDEPFRSQILQEFDNVVIRQGYGCDPRILEGVEEAVRNRKRIKILYESRRSQQTSWREVDPLRIYFLQKALYLYARCPNDDPKYRTLRISRVKEIKQSGVTFSNTVDDDDFYYKLENAFEHFMGKETSEVIIRFTGSAIEYIKETLWHASQRLEMQADGSVLFKVNVSEPREVLWWALQFGDKAEILAPSDLRAYAKNILKKSFDLYDYTEDDQQLSPGHGL